MKKYRVVLAIIFLAMALGCIAGNVTFTPIPTLQQLPVNAIHRVFQDQEGYMWYGTVDGLCRDDGYNTVVFRNDIHQQNAIANNAITAIEESPAGKIWFSTDQGIFRLDKNTYKIEHILPETAAFKLSFIIGKSLDGSIWATAQTDLLHISPDGELIKLYPWPKRFHAMHADATGRVWLTDDGNTLYYIRRG